MTPTVSIIIPVYNQGSYLVEAVDSILAQTVTDYEIIVIDDGSTDNTPQVCAQYGDVIRLTRQENQGLAATRNNGIALARGEFLGFLDSDDTWYPHYLQTMLNLSARHPNADVFYGVAHAIDSAGNVLPQLISARKVRPNEMYWTLLRDDFLVPTCVFARREVVVNAGCFHLDTPGCEDWDLWLRLLGSGTEFVGTQEVVAQYRLHDSSMSVIDDTIERSVFKMAVKQFGADDGAYGAWSAEKRRLFGAAYRHSAVVNLTRRHDWAQCARQLNAALRIDPDLATDMSLFYEVALGTQPMGYRGAAPEWDAPVHETEVQDFMTAVVEYGGLDDATCKVMRGTAAYALGLVAYNSGQKPVARRHLRQALRFRPNLIADKLLMGNLIKAMLKPT
jgi:glycosyltransferase involved in cell wall biosynthesis